MTQKYAFELMAKHFGSAYRKCLEWLSFIQGRLPMFVGVCGDTQINEIHSIEWQNDSTYIRIVSLVHKFCQTSVGHETCQEKKNTTHKQNKCHNTNKCQYYSLQNHILCIT